VASLEQVSIVTADGFGLQLSSGLANDLADRVTEAANALPKRGLEVCGLLLGEHTANAFAVTSLIPLTCRYPDGPAFRASEGELRDALQLVQPQSNVIGFYRSRNDGSLDLDHQDRLLLDLLARKPMPVLVIRQQKNTAGEGRLLIWGDGTGMGGVASAGDIFSTRQWMATARPASKPLKVPPIGDTRAVFRSLPAREWQLLPIPERQFEKTETVQKRDKARIAWIGAAALALLLPLFFGWRVQQLPPLRAGEPSREVRTANPPPLVVVPSRRALVAGEEPNSGEGGSESGGGTSQDAKALQSLKSWIRNDENSTLREIAVRELVRRGKEDPETLPLLGETAQMDTSDIVRAAALESIARGWKVNTATRGFFEERARSDKSLAVRQIAARELANASKASPVNEGSAALNEDRRAARRDVNEPVGNQPTVAEVPARSSAGSKPRQAARLFRPPWVGTSTPQTSELPLPAPIEVAGTTPELPILHAPLPTIRRRPASRLRPPGVVEFTPPVLIRQTQAISVPPGLRRLLRRETVISLRVAVDPRGRVSRIYPSESTGNVELSLWAFYADEARRWVFKPARRNDEAIPGETILRFRVTPYLRR
jgi:hypothetical protein